MWTTAQAETPSGDGHLRAEQEKEKGATEALSIEQFCEMF
jgi:hypothetical protein